MNSNPVRPIEQPAMMAFVFLRLTAEGDQARPTAWAIGSRAWVSR